MTRQDIIELATVNTERKYEKVGNAALALAIVLQQFCEQNRYWWRQFYTTFSTVTGQQLYDISVPATGLNPALVEVTLEEITQLALVTPGQPPGIGYLTPVFDPQTVIEMQQGINSNGTAAPGPPSRYTLAFGDYKTILLDVPDGIYKLAMTGWAMPNVSKDSTNPLVPLVPPQYHPILVSGLEAYIWSKIYGPQNEKYLSAKADYESQAALAQLKERFSTNANQQFIQGDEAIRSTS